MAKIAIRIAQDMPRAHGTRGVGIIMVKVFRDMIPVGDVHLGAGIRPAWGSGPPCRRGKFLLEAEICSSSRESACQ